MIWTINLEGGPRRVNHAAVFIDGYIYSFGGYCAGENFELRHPMDVHILDTVTLRWRTLPSPTPKDEQFFVTPYQRYGHTAVAYKGKAYIWGGRNDSDGACNLLYEFDTATQKFRRVRCTGITPPARDGHTACLIGDIMYVFGGFEEEFERFSNEVYALDLRTFHWSEFHTHGPAPFWRDFHSAVAIGDRMYIFGGRSDVMGQFHTNREVYSDQLKYLDIKTRRWVEPDTTGTGPSGRRSHSAFVYNEKMFIFGGFNGNDDVHFGNLFCYDPVTSHWTEMHPLIGIAAPNARRRQCCIVVGSKMYLFGGTSPLPAGHSHPQWGNFAPEVLEQLATNGFHAETKLVDHSDLFILDFEPSLKSLCQMALIRNKFNYQIPDCPVDLKAELQAMTKPNRISPFRLEILHSQQG